MSADLTGAQLSNGVLTHATLEGAIFTRADLSHADLTGAYLDSTALREATLVSAVLADADLTRV